MVALSCTKLCSVPGATKIAGMIYKAKRGCWDDAEAKFKADCPVKSKQRHICNQDSSEARTSGQQGVCKQWCQHQPRGLNQGSIGPQSLNELQNVKAPKTNRASMCFTRVILHIICTSYFTMEKQNAMQ